MPRKRKNEGTDREYKPPPTKYVCKVRRKHFKAKAPEIDVWMPGLGAVVLMPHQFKPGSFGWYYQGKLMSDLDGVEMAVQLNFCVTVVGSKDAAE